MNDAHQPQLDAPQLRTLLLTDLCDSTALVERIGDTAAAELFREHDHLVLTLQRQWRGRLIDRSDGLLLLFERPIDGLGFALDYVHCLKDLGDSRGLVLKARAGLHVGEVLTWHNSDEAVSVGAKPMEVEGLAKPMAARLMTLARPGQILLSAVAESLLHRSSRELGERAERLLWKSHGRWRFKGVPTSQEIYEVGEVGITPLRGPKSSSKAWRDIPLWRRPAALVAELTLMAVISIGGWLMTRPEPAIAFAERDWVVVGDMRNLTGDTRLDESLQQAFRISLEQSPYVNVLSDLKVRNTVGRMRRDSQNTLVDRAVGSEVALRDGARALVLPNVSEVGGRMKVSVEVIEPATQRTIYLDSVDGDGLRSLLPAIDQLTARLRGRLGEQLASISATSMPLPEVTTSNMDALRAYALAQRRYAIGDFNSALGLYVQARSMDPNFALAWLGEVRTRYATVDMAAAVVPLSEARKLQGRLPPREALYLSAWIKEFETPEEVADAWTQMAVLYPDYDVALGNAAMWLYFGNNFRQAMDYASRVNGAQYESSAINSDTLGRVALALGEYKRADQAFSQAVAAGREASRRGQFVVASAERNFERADELLLKIPSDNRHIYIDATTMLLDRGLANLGVEKARQGLELANKAEGFDRRMYPLLLGVAYWQAGRKREAMTMVKASSNQSIRKLSENTGVDVVDDATLALAAGIVSLRLGDDLPAKESLAALAKRPELGRVRVVKELMSVTEAELLRLAGNPQHAIELLTPYLNDGSERFQTRVAMMKSLRAAGKLEDSLKQVEWLKTHRGMAYAELQCGYCLQSLNIIDSNEAFDQGRSNARIAALR